MAKSQEDIFYHRIGTLRKLTSVKESNHRDHSRFAPSQWKTVLLCSDISHRLGASLESTLNELYDHSISGLRWHAWWLCNFAAEVAFDRFGRGALWWVIQCSMKYPFATVNIPMIYPIILRIILMYLVGSGYIVFRLGITCHGLTCYSRTSVPIFITGMSLCFALVSVTCKKSKSTPSDSQMSLTSSERAIL